MSETDTESPEKEERSWDRLGSRFARWKQSILERTRPHKTLHYWVKKAFEEILAIRIIRFIFQLIVFLLLFYAGITYVLGYDPLLESGLFAGLAFLLPIFGYIPVVFDMPHGIAQGTATGFFDIIQLVGQAGMFPFIALGAVLIIPILIGRSFCGWVCPFGFIQDLCSLTPIRTRTVSKQTNRLLSWIKYIFLFTTLFFVLWVGLWTFLGIESDLVYTLNSAGGFATAWWSVISPSGTFFVIIPYLWLNGIISPIITQWNPSPLSWWPIMWIRLIFLLIVLVAALFYTRAYCRWICPVGAMMGLVSQFSFLTVSRSATECLHGRCEEQRCTKACPVGIDVMAQPPGKLYHRDCIMCLDCVAKCGYDAMKVDYS